MSGYSYEEAGNDLNPVAAFFIGLFVSILFLLLLGLALGVPIFSLYVLIAITMPWAIHALMAAGLAHSAALFIVLLPTTGVLTLLFLGIVALINFIRQKNTITDYIIRRLPEGDDKEQEEKMILVSIFVTLSLLFCVPVGLGVGVYLSVLIIPAVVTSIMAMGVSFPLALFAGIFLAFDLVALSTMFFMAPTWLGWRLVAMPKWRDIAENPMQMLPFLGMLGGLAVGIYLTTMVYPILITALTAIALPHAAVVLTALILVFEMIFATSFLIFGGTTGLAHLFGWINKDEPAVCLPRSNHQKTSSRGHDYTPRATPTQTLPRSSNYFAGMQYGHTLGGDDDTQFQSPFLNDFGGSRGLGAPGPYPSTHCSATHTYEENNEPGANHQTYRSPTLAKSLDPSDDES